MHFLCSYRQAIFIVEYVLKILKYNITRIKQQKLFMEYFQPYCIGIYKIIMVLKAIKVTVFSYCSAKVHNCYVEFFFYIVLCNETSQASCYLFESINKEYLPGYFSNDSSISQKNELTFRSDFIEIQNMLYVMYTLSKRETALE